MDQGMRRLLAAAVLLCGIGAAMAFRQPARAPGPTTEPSAIPSPAEAAQALRGPPATLGPRGNSPRPPPAVPPTASGPASPPQAPASPPSQPLKPVAPPPYLAQVYPHGRSAWTVGREAEAFETAMRVHRVVDGDTLETIARRYYQESWPAQAIFEANRHVLADPALLPIGAELRIPARESLGPPPTSAPTRLEEIGDGGLVPIR